MQFARLKLQFARLLSEWKESLSSDMAVGLKVILGFFWLYR